jgi:hypothetical protein
MTLSVEPRRKFVAASECRGVGSSDWVHSCTDGGCSVPDPRPAGGPAATVAARRLLRCALRLRVRVFGVRCRLWYVMQIPAAALGQAKCPLA